MKHWLKFFAYLAVALAVSSAQASAYEDFFRAVGSDDARTVGALLARGFDPNSPDEKGQTGLYLAIRDGADKVATTLIEAPGARLDAANAAGETALMMAALRGREDLARRLVEHGAQVHREGWTPLHYAASGPSPKLVAFLLDRGARIDAPSPNHSTPLMMAAGYGNPDAAELLLKRGANARLRNDAGMTAADFARRAGRDALAERLARAAQ